MEIITDDIKNYNESWWDNFYKKHTHEMSPSDKLHFEIAANIIKKRSVLDFGCGEGRFSQFVKNYTGTDWSSEAIKKAKERFPDKKFVSEIDGKFDFIVMFEVFEHLENPKETIEGLRKYTDNFIVALPREDFGRIVVENDTELMKTISEHTKYHYATYSEDDIKNMFPEATFIKVDSNHIMFVC